MEITVIRPERDQDDQLLDAMDRALVAGAGGVAAGAEAQ